MHAVRHCHNKMTGAMTVFLFLFFVVIVVAAAAAAAAIQVKCQHSHQPLTSTQIWNQNQAIVELLLEQRADPLMQNLRMNTALHFAYVTHTLTHIHTRALTSSHPPRHSRFLTHTSTHPNICKNLIMNNTSTNIRLCILSTISIPQYRFERNNENIINLLLTYGAASCMST